MSDVTLLGCLRLPIEAWDVENYSFVVQQQARCVQAADRIEELEKQLTSARKASNSIEFSNQ